jgi:hypothetical protein
MAQTAPGTKPFSLDRNIRLYGPEKMIVRLYLSTTSFFVSLYDAA